MSIGSYRYSIERMAEKSSEMLGNTVEQDFYGNKRSRRHKRTRDRGGNMSTQDEYRKLVTPYRNSG